MKNIGNLVCKSVSVKDLDDHQRAMLANELSQAVGQTIYEASVTISGGHILALARDGRVKRLIVVAESGKLGAFGDIAESRRQLDDDGAKLDCAMIAVNHVAADALRKEVLWLLPRLGGLACSVGLGDRLGCATPGHVRSVVGSGCFPVFAQQSIREMTRTERSPADVMDDAMWGVFEAGWRSGYGSDADHLKSTADIDTCAAVGFKMYTIDPGDHVCSEADAMDASALDDAMKGLAWDALEIYEAEFRSRYIDQTFHLDGGEPLTFDAETAARAVVKYGGAIAHTAAMFRHLKGHCQVKEFELEVSVDETDTPTTVAEHYLIAAELKRLGVQWVSLAPRFIGEFEKGIDYKGDLAAFERSFAEHVAVVRTLGPYKLSIHSGSDKFAVYPIAAKLAGEWVHLKTAGTSYLEALRVVARKKPELFRKILDYAFTRFDEDRATYHISARAEAVAKPNDLTDEQLETVLNGNDGRQLLHVTYGSVLTDRNDAGEYRFRNDLLDVLADYEEEHYAVLASHLRRHVKPLVR